MALNIVSQYFPHLALKLGIFFDFSLHYLDEHHSNSESLVGFSEFSHLFFVLDTRLHGCQASCFRFLFIFCEYLILEFIGKFAFILGHVLFVLKDLKLLSTTLKRFLFPFVGAFLDFRFFHDVIVYLNEFFICDM